MTALHTFLRQADKLPTPPAIALKILEAVRQEENNFNDLANIVTSDPVLTAKLLKIANSSIYSLPKQVTSLAQATALLGTQTLQNIALSFVLVDTYKDLPQSGFDIDLFWRRSISTAVSAKLLARATGNHAEDLFITALLQDIGILALFLTAPVAFTEVLDNKRISGKSMYEAEQERFGFDHSALGAHLLESWQLPAAIYEPIRCHHCTEEASKGDLALLLDIADRIGSIYHGNRGNTRYAEVHRLLSTTFAMDREQIDKLIDDIGAQARETMDLFAVNPGEMKPFSLLMQEANDELRRLNFSYEQVVLELKQAKNNAEQLAVSLKAANDRLRELAFRDDLTGLYNHRYFQEILEREVQRSIRYKHPLSLLLLDIDFFKNVNDTYGHPSGDRVLQLVSRKMEQLVRHCDIVARYGGEEFAIVLPETGRNGANVLATRIRRGIEQLKIKLNEKEISVTVSIGLTSTDIDRVPLNRAALIAQSDKALYRAKTKGRNRVERAA